jgi:HAD superfamily hydrolase (TIGR01509 family)
MISAVIFDLDGLLADTEILHCQAYQMAFAEHGIELSAPAYADHWIRQGKGIADWIDLHELAFDPHALRMRKSEYYLRLLESSLRPMDGARELLESLHGKFRLALASSSYRDAIDGVLAGLEMAAYFEAVVSGLDVKQVKPAPDIFLLTARILKVNPSECLVFEDAEKGVIAAHAAGMRCVAVPNDFTRHHDFSKATRVCASLRDIDADLLTDLESSSCLATPQP